MSAPEVVVLDSGASMGLVAAEVGASVIELLAAVVCVGAELGVVVAVASQGWVVEASCTFS